MTNHQPISYADILIRPTATADAPCPALIEKLDRKGALRVSLNTPLKEGSMVEVEFESKYIVTGQVLNSLPGEGSYFATIGLQEDRRRQPRFQVNEQVEITAMNRHLTLKTTARLVDVSEQGIGLMTDVMIPHDTLLKLVFDSAVVFAEVRHCSRLDGERYRVGLEIETVIFRDAREPNWPFSPRTLWASFGAGFQYMIGKR